MKTEFRNRAFLPVAIPVGIMLGIAAFVGLFAWILLYNTKEGALVLAGVMATGILIAVALAATEDELDPRRRLGVTLALGGPIVAGMVLAGTGGGVEDVALLNINREEIVVVEIPEAHVTLVAFDLTQFEQQRLTLPAGQEVAIVFDNEHVGTAHNVAYQVAGEGGTAPESLTADSALGVSDTKPGVAQLPLIFTADAGTYWYWCTIHPTMNGLLEVADGAEPSAS